jgi:hypothetical protein
MIMGKLVIQNSNSVTITRGRDVFNPTNKFKTANKLAHDKYMLFFCTIQLKSIVTSQ